MLKNKLMKFLYIVDIKDTDNMKNLIRNIYSIPKIKMIEKQS